MALLSVVSMMELIWWGREGLCTLGVGRLEDGMGKGGLMSWWGF